MKIRKSIKADLKPLNHNQSCKLVIRTSVKSGRLAVNHNQSRA